MTRQHSQITPRRGRVFPEIQLSTEEKACRRAENEAFHQRCLVIFERVQPELIKNHYNWYILIEPSSGNYFIDPDVNVAKAKAHTKHPDKKCLIMRINETGACGRI